MQIINKSTELQKLWENKEADFKELLRFREYLAEQYVKENKNPEINDQIYNGLISLSVESYNMLN